MEKRLMLGFILEKMDKDCDLVPCYDSVIDSEFYFSPDKEDDSNYGKFMTYLKNHLEVEKICFSNSSVGLIVNLYDYLDKPNFIKYAKEHFFEKHQYSSDEDVVELLFDDFVANIGQGFKNLSERFLEMMQEYYEVSPEFEIFQSYETQNMTNDIKQELETNHSVKISDDYIKSFIAPEAIETLSNNVTYGEIYWEVVKDVLNNFLENYPIRNGNKYVYDSHNADTELNHFTGTEITIVRPLTNDECDIDEVGNMYKAKFLDGSEHDVFEDELVFIGGEV